MHADILERLETAIAARKGAAPERSYVARLHAKGLDAILKKIGEEAAETIIAAKSDAREPLIHEVADLLFHTLVLLGHRDIPFDDVLAELARREGVSGLDEKRSRGEAP